MTSGDDKKKQSFLSKLSKKTKKGIQKLGETNLEIANKIENKFSKMFGIPIETMDGFITCVPPSNDTNTIKQSSLKR